MLIPFLLIFRCCYNFERWCQVPEDQQFQMLPTEKSSKPRFSVNQEQHYASVNTATLPSFKGTVETIEIECSTFMQVFLAGTF